MTTENTKPSGNGKDNGAELAATVAGFQHDALDRIEKVGSAVLEGITRWNSEVSRFIADRIEEDVRTQKEMMRCQTLKDLQTVQSRFVSTAMEQYSTETRRLMDVSRSIITATNNRA